MSPLELGSWHAWAKTLRYKVHEVRLKYRIRRTGQSDCLDSAYVGYLETQLARTLSQKREGLPVRARAMIDELGRLTDIASCDVLCVGCRDRAEIDYFRLKGARSVVGIDLYSEHPEIRIMDMHHMGFDEDRFDVVYSSHSLEHAWDAARVVQEIIRVARDGGTVAVEVPVEYEARGADLVDFGSAEAVRRAFEPHVRHILWSEEYDPGTASNPSGTRVARIIFVLCKEPLVP